MPGKTSVGSALAGTGDSPAADTVTAASAAEARIVRLVSPGIIGLRSVEASASTGRGLRLGVILPC
ncbi:hypothetical protein MCNS_26600 [Mycobacterium conspicuum]|uniref:Uncharacterized protein n=1 Tax=Mycobacterium conspicuum TaxID=44010 RepID=A0A7I7YDS4_9MYCO|nr:hypothetical protein MCNS_26600 [Mycobacterium conspicuum]